MYIYSPIFGNVVFRIAGPEGEQRQAAGDAEGKQRPVL